MCKKIIAAALAIICLGTLVGCDLINNLIDKVISAKETDNFDYFTSDLEEYVEFTDSYKSFEVAVDIAKPKDIDVDVSILNMLCGDKPGTAWVESSTDNLMIKPGDVVYVWYRGYLVGENGEAVVMDGMSNFLSDSSYPLEIGSGGFIPGFELNLVGKQTGNYSTFTKIKEGLTSDGSIAYVSYTKELTKTDGTVEKTYKSDDRIDLYDENVDAVYGEGFLEKIKSLTVASASEFNTTLNGEAVAYTNLKVVFVTNCESNPMLIDCYFPYNYGRAELKNKNARFEVYVEKIDSYYEEMPVADDEYIKSKIEDKTIPLTLEELEEYNGETLADKYRDYLQNKLDKNYETNLRSMTVQAVWSHYLEIAQIEKYPESKVKEVYKTYEDDLKKSYSSSGGMIYDSYYGTYVTYNNFNQYANAFLGINIFSQYYHYGDTAWQYYIENVANDAVKERLILYYILRSENLLPTEENLASEVALMKQEYVEKYILQYLANEGKTEADYPGESWNEFKKQREEEILSYYDNSFFEEQVHYDVAINAMLGWAKVTTLD